MRILITGAFGYLGGRITRHLATQRPDAELLLCTRGQRGRPAWLARGEVVTTDPGLTFARARLAGVNTVIHLAAMNENDCGVDLPGACEVNSLGTARLLDEAIRQGVERFVYFSTARVYREPLTGLITEATPCRPVHPYGISHKGAEDYVLAAHDRQQCIGLAIRLANGFGAPEQADVNRWTLLTNDLCRQAVEKEALILKSSGIQLRNFITLEDVALAVDHLLDLPRASLGDGIFNLAETRSRSILEMTSLIASRCPAILGREVALHRPTPDPAETVAPLDYRVDRLLATGFRHHSHFEAEIDATLKLCLNAFGPDGRAGTTRRPT